MDPREDAQHILDDMKKDGRDPKPILLRRGLFATGVSVIVGLFFIVVGLAPNLRESLGERFDIVSLLCFAMGIQLILFAILVRSVHQLRIRVREILGHILDLFYGKNYRRVRDSVDILIQALDGQDPVVVATSLKNLARLTGEDFGDNPDAWKLWWAGNRNRFRPKTSGGSNAPESSHQTG